MEAGQAAGPKRRLMRRIPSFEAFVELREDLPTGKSRHGNAAAQAAKDAAPLQQCKQTVHRTMQQQQQEEQGSALDAGATAGSASRNSGQDQQQQQQATGGAGSMPASAAPGKDANDLQPHLSVIVMPDGQHLALAVPEIDVIESTDATGRGAGNSTGQSGAGTNAQQQQSRMRRAGRAVLRAVVYLFVQPVPSARDFEQTYVAGNQRGVNRTTLL
jgi:hypothetical protein